MEWLRAVYLSPVAFVARADIEHLKEGIPEDVYRDHAWDRRYAAHPLGHGAHVAAKWKWPRITLEWKRTARRNKARARRVARRKGADVIDLFAKKKVRPA